MGSLSPERRGVQCFLRALALRSRTTGETDGERGMQPNQPDGAASRDQPGVQPNQPEGAAPRGQRGIQRNRRVWVALHDQPEGAAQQFVLRLALRRDRTNRYRMTSRAHDERLVLMRQGNRWTSRQNNGREPMPEQGNEEEEDSENPRGGHGRSPTPEE